MVTTATRAKRNSRGEKSMELGGSGKGGGGEVKIISWLKGGCGGAEKGIGG